MSELPSKEEYESKISVVFDSPTSEWSEPKYKCSKCGGGMCKNHRYILASMPARYKYRCDTCGHTDYLFR